GRRMALKLFATLNAQFDAARKLPGLAARLSSAQRELTALRMQDPTASGVPITGGAYHYELTKALQGRQRWEVLDRMEADSHVKGTIRDNTLPLLTAKWDVKPASSSARDTDAAEFVSANLLRAGGDTYGEDYYCQTSFIGQRLPEICDMLRAGYSM